MLETPYVSMLVPFVSEEVFRSHKKRTQGSTGRWEEQAMGNKTTYVCGETLARTWKSPCARTRKPGSGTVRPDVRHGRS